MNHSQRLVNNAGVQIHCLEFNTTSTGIPLIVVPGMINSAEQVADEIGQYLTGRTIILSLRGRGKSDSPIFGWTLDDQASDVTAVIAAYGFDQVILFGHSAGASIAARSLPSIKARVAGFVIGDFAPFYPPYHEQWKQHIMGLPERQISDDALEGIVRDAKYEDVMANLQQSAASILVITGEPERSVLRPEEIEKMKERLPRAEVSVLAGCGHEFLSDDPARAVEILERFTAGLESAS